MASGGWLVFLFLFILGVVCGAYSQLGIWQNHYPQTGYTVSMDTVNGTESASVPNGPSALSIFVIYSWVVAFVTVIFSGIVAVFSLSLLFYGLGFPINAATAAILQMIQVPATLIALMWLYELWTGRQV
jgi:hypothetical protein